MKKNTIAIILAAGEGTRMHSNGINKTALDFNNKPMICYAVDAVANSCGKIIIVIGAYANTVKEALKNYNNIDFVVQEERLGTGHAVQVAIKYLIDNDYIFDNVIVGYGDHMMFYKPSVISNFVNQHHSRNSKISLLTTEAEDPNSLAWGRIIRDINGDIKEIVEHKDATIEQKRVKEVNPGFYCFDFEFLVNNIFNLDNKNISHEYYLTDMVDIAFSKNIRPVGIKVSFKDVGVGVNSRDQLENSQKLYQQVN